MNKSFLILLCCTTYLVACKTAIKKTSKVSDPYPLSFSYTIVAKDASFPLIWPVLDPDSVVYLKTALVNHSRYVIAYQTMTCSKEWMYTAAPNDLLETQMRYNCTVNTLTQEYLAPKDTLYQNIAVRIKGKQKGKGGIRGRIGFGYIVIDPSRKWDNYRAYRIYKDSLFDARHSADNVV